MAAKRKTIEINEKTPLLFIAGPMFLEMFLGTMLNNVDTLMLSHYNENSVGAVGNANQFMFLVNILFNVIATATSVVVAQYLGAKQYEKMNMIYTLSIFFNATLGVLISIGLIVANPLLMDIVRISDEMRPDAMMYVYIVGGGAFLMAVYNVLMQILRCNGFPKIGMYISFGINIINIGGNYLFLYGPLKHLNMGVSGVAISTVTARVIAVVAAFICFFALNIGKLAIKYIRPFPFALLWKMIKIGLPSAGENFSYSMYQMCLLSVINTMGNDSVNAKVYCNTIIAFAMIFSNASAMATQIITGHLVGAGKEEIAYKRVFKTLLISMPITIGLATTNWLLSRYTLRFFTDNENVIRLGVMIMFVDIFIEIGRCLNMTFVSSLKAAGAFIFPLIVGLFTMWGLGLGLGFTFGKIVGLGVAGVFMGTASDECIRGLIVMYYWYKKKWYGKAIVDKKEEPSEAATADG